MKFAIVTDVHIGEYRPFKGVYRKVTPYSEKLVTRFIESMNGKFKPDFVVQGEDLIEDTNLSVDRKNYDRGLELFKQLKCPVHHLVGNHDACECHPSTNRWKIVSASLANSQR